MEVTRCQPQCPAHTTMFCGVCNKADPAELATVDFKSFTGKDSLNSNVEHFLSTGDPSRV